MGVPNLGGVITTTLANRSKELVDLVSKNNALFAYLSKAGNIKPVDGGETIREEFTYDDEDGDDEDGWYSGFDELDTSRHSSLDAAEYTIKQIALPVMISGLEEIQNAGKEKVLDLLDGRIEATEQKVINRLSKGAYSDGTAAGGKQIGGLDLLIPTDPTSGTAGGINRADWTFWRSYAKSYTSGSGLTKDTVQGLFNDVWANVVRGSDRPSVIPVDGTVWAAYIASLQAQQRFTGTEAAALGFPSVKFMDADVVLDGGVGGFATTGTAYFVNTKYIRLRPIAGRNMVPLPGDRYGFNQDARLKYLAWAGNMTMRGAVPHGRLFPA